MQNAAKQAIELTDIEKLMFACGDDDSDASDDEMGGSVSNVGLGGAGSRRDARSMKDGSAICAADSNEESLTINHHQGQRNTAAVPSQAVAQLTSQQQSSVTIGGRPKRKTQSKFNQPLPLNPCLFFLSFDSNLSATAAFI